MTKLFTIHAYLKGQYLGSDEAHVGMYAGRALTLEDSHNAILNLLDNQPDGWTDVTYEREAIPDGLSHAGG